MRLEIVLEHLNSFEKNAFLKIIGDILSKKPAKTNSAVEQILSDSNKDLKNMDNINIAKVFNLVESEFSEYVRTIFADTTSQFDILADLIIRDGHCILKQDWFARLYDIELSNLKEKIDSFQKNLDTESADIDESRKRDFKIYRSCLHTAYYNDTYNNQDSKISSDEQSILITLINQLGLSQEEVKLINYLTLPVKKQDIDVVVNDLKSAGLVFFSKKTNTIFIPDEIVRIVRRARGKDVADKFFRRVLRLLREPQINLICKRYNLDWRNPLEKKIEDIINAGISFSSVLLTDIFKEGTLVSERKKFINEFCDKELKIDPPLRGATIEEKVNSLIKYFDEIERDEKVGISIDGYEKMIKEMGDVLQNLNQQIIAEFQLQSENVLNSKLLLDYNIKPRDILDIISLSELETFCTAKAIKTRGDIVANILDAYKDAENLYLENYENIGFRNLSALKQNGVELKESDIGIKFEDLTKVIFEKLGFTVDEALRKELNTDKDRIDVVLNLGNNDLILIECKTIKESGYNKFSSVSRQLKSYSNLIKLKGYKLLKSLIIAPDFSEDFVKDCGLDCEMNLSLLSASALIKILNGFKASTKYKQLPYNLFMRDVLIDADRVLTAIEK